MKKVSLPALFLSLFAAVIILIWFRNGNLIGAGEAGVPFYDLLIQYKTVQYSWAFPALGTATSIATASAPTYFVLSFLQSLGIKSFVLEAGVFLILFLTAGLSIYSLTKLLFPTLPSRYLTLAVLFYWFNPISLVSVWNRSLTNFMFFWALLPLSVWLFTKGAISKRYSFSCLTGISLLFFSYALTSTPFNILILGIFTFITLFLIIASGFKDKIFFTKYYLLTTLFYIGLNAWWISQLFDFISSHEYQTAKQAFFSSNENLQTLSSLSERLGSIYNITRFLHIDYLNTGPFWAQLYLVPEVSILGFLPSALILWVIYKYHKVKEVMFLSIIFLGTLFLMKGDQPPFGELFQYLFVKFSFIQVFRNPFEKFGFLLPLAAAPLFSFGLKELVDSTSKPFLKRVYYFLLAAVVVILWGFPFWTGLVFTRVNPLDHEKLNTYEVIVPKYYQEANDWLLKQGDNFRFISFPLGGEGMTYTWDKPYSGVELSSVLFNTPNISFNTSLPLYYQISSDLPNYQLSKDFLSYVPFTNTKYILARSDIDFVERKLPSPAKVTQNLDNLESQKLLSKKFTSGRVKIYQVSDDWFWPKIYMTNKSVVSNERDLVRVISSIEDFPQKKVAILSTDNLNNDFGEYILSSTLTNISSNDRFYQIDYTVEISKQDDYLILNKDLKAQSTKIDDKLIYRDKIFLGPGRHKVSILIPKEEVRLLISQTQDIALNDNERFTKEFTTRNGENLYLVSLEYKFSQPPGFSNSFNLGFFQETDYDIEPSTPGFFMAPASDKWYSWSGQFKDLKGDQIVKLKIYPFKKQNCEYNFFTPKTCHNEELPYLLTVRNLKVEEVHIPIIQLKSITKTLVSKDIYINWQKSNPTHYQIRFSKIDNNPQVLVFSELFNSGWQLRNVKTGEIIKNHVLVNSYANGWVVKEAGVYDLSLDYLREVVLKYAINVTYVSLLLCLILSVYLLKHEHSN